MELFRENFNTAEEHPEPHPAKITGEFPEWLRGSFLRVGPGKFDLGDFTVNHWFDGLALLHKFCIGGGQVSFRTKYLRSDAYKKACVAQKPVYTEFGTHSYPDPCKNIFSRMFSSFDANYMTDNASNNVLCVNDELFVATDTCFIRRIDPHSLDTKDKVDLNKITSVNFCSSHPLTDDTGTTYNLGGTFIGTPKYHIVRCPPSKDGRKSSDPWMGARIHSSISSSWRTSYGYNHSFGMSENYLVFLEQPLIVNTLKLATSQVKSRSLHDCIEWHPQEKVKFNIIRKSTGEVLKIRYMCEESFFAFHHVNTYEVNGNIVVDLICYRSPEILNKLYLNKVRMNEYNNEDPPQMMRFVLPLLHDMQSVPEGQELVTVPGTSTSAIKIRDSQGSSFIKVTGMEISEPGFDMPTVNPQYEGKFYRYVYGTGGYEKAFFHNAVCKVDAQTGRTWLWRGTEYQYPSEPTFVSPPDAIDEDDGVLLVSVCDVRRDHPDFLLVLNAQTMEEVARAEVDVPLPNALHGIFMSNRL